MNSTEMNRLERKYKGNEEDITEGEAMAIKHDPNHDNDTDDMMFTEIPPAGKMPSTTDDLIT